MEISKSKINNIEIITGENEHIKFSIAPSIGGKIVSVYNKDLEKEFLWDNKNLSLKTNSPGSDYDTNFWGGIDELIPNDIPEVIDGIDYPDHGELWTSQLQYELSDHAISVFGMLPLSGLFYKKTISLSENSPELILEYTIRNESEETRNFMWKLHAALAIEKGDKIISKAKKAKVVYPQESRFVRDFEFEWPFINNYDASLVPSNNNTLDFFYLYQNSEGKMSLESANGKDTFSYSYDEKIFPYQWYFASYGKFLNHYTAILEPSTTMPVSVSEAKLLDQCTVLKSKEELKTRVIIYAGGKNP